MKKYVKKAQVARNDLARPSSLHFEVLEGRMLNAAADLDGMLAGFLVQAISPASSYLAPSAPNAVTFSLTGATTVSGNSAQLSVSSVNVQEISGLKYTWSILRSPSGGKVTFSNNASADAKVNTLSFNKCGSYTVQVAIEGNGLAAQSITKDVTVTPTLNSFSFLNAAGEPVSSTTEMAVNSRNCNFKVCGLDQFGNSMTKVPTLSWTASAQPLGGNFNVLAAGAALTAAFNKAGQYRLVARCGTLPTKEVAFNVIPTITFVSASEPNGAAIRTQSPLPITSDTFRASAFAIDQFGERLAQQPRITWSATSAAAGGSVKSTVDVNSCLFEFPKSGNYTLKAQCENIQLSISAIVTIPARVLANLKVSQSSVAIRPNQSVDLSVQALDQFETPLVSQPAFMWTATAGRLTTGSSTSTVSYVADSEAGNFFITVRAGNLSKLIAVQILADNSNVVPIQTPDLAKLVGELYQDKQLSRNDVIAILRSTTTDGVVDQSEYLDLKTIFSAEANYVMPAYVSTLARNIVGTSPANRQFQGSALGDLRAGSSATVMNRLVDKWFLGADPPTTTSPAYTYTNATGRLFNGRPTHFDTRQGSLGDCYLISAFGALADSNPDAIRNMFIDNGDGTFSVRFYASMGNPNTAGTADYVTVNRQLPVDSRGLLVYSNASSYATDGNLSLWAALAEKAYTQWNETDKEGRDGTNRYSAINGGNSYYVFGQVLGYEASNYSFVDANKKTLIDSLNARKAVILATNNKVSTLGLVGCHGYTVTGYNAGTDTFSAYNPWGYAHPSPLTWAQLKKDGGGFTVADTSFTISPNTYQSSLRPVSSSGFGVALLTLESNAVRDENQIGHVFSPRPEKTTSTPSVAGILTVGEHKSWDWIATFEMPDNNEVSEELRLLQAAEFELELLSVLSMEAFR